MKVHLQMSFGAIEVYFLWQRNYINFHEMIANKKKRRRAGQGAAHRKTTPCENYNLFNATPITQEWGV